MKISSVSPVLLCLAPWLCGEFPLSAAEPKFDRIVIDAEFPGGYQVEVADVNGDKKPDIVALGGGTCAWYENPSWKKRIVTTPKQTPGIISSATADLDGDGNAEIAIAYEFEMNEPKKGKLLLAVQGASVDEPWTTKPISDVGSIHRLRWGDWDGDRRLDLIVAPIFGPEAKPPSYDQSPARLTVFDTGKDAKAGQWTSQTLAERPVLHAIEVNPNKSSGRAEILTADNLGVAILGVVKVEGDRRIGDYLSLTTGTKGEPPKRGASEIHHGSLRGERRFLATIEPWHGGTVVVATDPITDAQGIKFSRTVIDDTLDDGHALWVADIDGDGDDEVFAGHRGKDHRVSVYKFDGKSWNRTVLDREIAAQDLRGGDLDGDGTPDVVAIGGATHNVVWYRPRK